MKNKTKAKILTGVMVVATLVLLSLMLLGCDNGTTQQEQPKAQSAEITGLFDNNASATVKGTLSDSEWNGVADKIETALNASFNAAPEFVKNVYRTVYTQESGVLVIIEQTSEYAIYKMIGDGKTIYFNFDILNYADVLQSTISVSLALSSNSTDMAKAVPAVPKYNRAVQLETALCLTLDIYI